MAKRMLSRWGQWYSRVFAVECDRSTDPLYFALSKTPQERHYDERQALYEKMFEGAKCYSVHVCTDDRFQRALLYESLKNNVIPRLPTGCSVLDAFSFHPDVSNSLFRGFFIKDATNLPETAPILGELVKNSGMSVCTYVWEENSQRWWQHLLSEAEDGSAAATEKFYVVPSEIPHRHPSTLNIMGNDVFYNFEDAYKVMEQCKDIIPVSEELLKLVGPNLTQKKEGRFPVIVIEGLDATGKTTLTHSLTATLNATLLRSPPTCLSPWRPCFDSEPALLRRAFYALGNYITASQIAAASEHSPVIVDRYWHSTAAYAIATATSGKVGNLPSPGSEVYRWPCDLLRPDLVLLLTVSPEERLRRLSLRGVEKTREEAELEANHLFRNK
ncbi:hypothetical protein JZ751_002513 [Albula glossodonta]|uniref:UMP-CMP kinase 2, mitochondrial n=1 Tax=Albula glossodonta TaxID=121402 RepID=A0A8T2N8A7_9TELE|nr:hypothetical protein JZ751_002513 [Albula glossodonta]